ncbi:MAG TPA: hypothetical protein VFZ61_18885, partial [Polyangiales bacterium]
MTRKLSWVLLIACALLVPACFEHHTADEVVEKVGPYDDGEDDVDGDQEEPDEEPDEDPDVEEEEDPPPPRLDAGTGGSRRDAGVDGGARDSGVRDA